MGKKDRKQTCLEVFELVRRMGKDVPFIHVGFLGRLFFIDG